MSDPGDATIAAYQAAADRYAEQTATPTPALLEYLDQFAALVGSGRVLEIGSGPGYGAAYLEQRGLQVERTDATPAFVDMMRAQGHAVRQLDARMDDLGGPYDGIVADAVLLHLDRGQFADLLVRARRAVTSVGVLGFTVKEGDGAGWTNAKLGRPRHYTYWRAPQLRQALADAGWELLSLEHYQGRFDPWLHVLSRADSCHEITTIRP